MRACWAAATHCVTGSPGPCPASCSPAECGWARRSPGSPSNPRTGTRLTAALDVTNVNTFLSGLLKAPQIKSNQTLKKKQSVICPNRTFTAGWSGMETLAKKSTRLFSLDVGRGTVSLINIQNNSNRSRKWPTYCTDILPTSSSGVPQPLYDG